MYGIEKYYPEDKRSVIDKTAEAIPGPISREDVKTPLRIGTTLGGGLLGAATGGLVGAMSGMGEASMFNMGSIRDKIKQRALIGAAVGGLGGAGAGYAFGPKLVNLAADMNQAYPVPVMGVERTQRGFTPYFRPEVNGRGLGQPEVCPEAGGPPMGAGRAGLVPRQYRMQDIVASYGGRGLGQPEVCPETGGTPTNRGQQGVIPRKHKIIQNNVASNGGRGLGQPEVRPETGGVPERLGQAGVIARKHKVLQDRVASSNAYNPYFRQLVEKRGAYSAPSTYLDFVKHSMMGNGGILDSSTQNTGWANSPDQAKGTEAPMPPEDTQTVDTTAACGGKKDKRSSVDLTSLDKKQSASYYFPESIVLKMQRDKISTGLDASCGLPSTRSQEDKDQDKRKSAYKRSQTIDQQNKDAKDTKEETQKKADLFSLDTKESASNYFPHSTVLKFKSESKKKV